MAWINYLLGAGIAICYVFIIFICKQFFPPKSYITPSFSKRLAAMLVDTGAILTVITLVFIARIWLDPDYRGVFQKFFNQQFLDGGDLFFAAIRERIGWSVLIYFVFAFLIEITPLHRTFGKQLFDLKIRAVKTERTPSMGALVIRGILRPIVILIWPLTFILHYTNPRRQWLHDLVAETYVVDQDKISK